MFEGSHARAWLTAGTSAVALSMAVPALAQTAAPTPPAPAGVPASGGLGSASTAAPAGVSAVPTDNGARTNTVSPPTVGSNAVAEIVVTAERRQESIQDTPVAVSAFSADNLKAKRLDGGENLVLSVPNVNYSRSNFGGYNFQIRGVGTHLVTNSGEPGVSFNVNSLPVTLNHFGDTDFYDVQRVEVLRGPQGTLYGRTATGGAVNVITAKPVDRPEGSLTAEFGNYDSKKITGFINVPINDFVQFRIAGFGLDRGGFGTNSVTGDRVDGRLLDSWRATVDFKLNDRLRASLMFEDYDEKDDRNRVGKQLCIKDPGPTSIGGTAVNANEQGFFSQGCQSGSLYQNSAYGTVNSVATTGGIFSALAGLTSGDAFANHPLQNHNLHDIESAFDPVYQAKERLAILEIDYDLTDNLHLSSITGYNRATDYSREDYNRLVASQTFNATPSSSAVFPALIAESPAFQAGVAAALAPRFGGSTAAAAAFLATAPGQAVVAQQAGLYYGGVYAGLFPGGYVNDPQVGYRNRFAVFDQTDDAGDEKTEELRLSSSFKGPLNFSVGAIFVNSVVQTDYYVLFNPLTAFIQADDTVSGDPGFTGVPPGTFYVDPNGQPTGFGHNYYDSRTGDMLNSYAGFGEVYYKLTNDIKLTAGFRYTVDHKKGTFYPSLLFAANTAPTAPVTQSIGFEEPSARFNVEWTPHLSFTNQTLVYFTYSHGYKSGGFNTPTQDSQFNAVIPAPFQPEIVNSYEAGTKNTLLGGSLVLNLTGFYYDYNGYQISTIRNKASFNSNVDAELYGFEFEGVWQPIHNLTLNSNIGYLHTEIKDYSQYDPADPTLGDSGLQVVKDTSGENCVVNAAALGQVLAAIGGADPLTQLGGIVGIPGSTTAPGLCNGGGALGALFPQLYNYGNRNIQFGTGSQAKVGLGVIENLNGKQLPNSPEFTVSLGAQYVFQLPRDWTATIRGDYYWQDSSYARYFNSSFDRLESYDVTNATLTFDNARWGVNVQLFVKNLTNSQPFTSFYLTAQDSGLFTNIFTLDPRTYGVSLTKRF